MTDKIIVFVTCESREQGERIAEAAVTEKLAACVNVIEGVRSCYVWEGKMTWESEVLLMMKSTQGRFQQLQAKVKELHSYEVPEIVSVVLEDGLDGYIDWIDERVGGLKPPRG